MKNVNAAKSVNIVVIADVEFPVGMASTAYVKLMLEGLMNNDVEIELVIPTAGFTEPMLRNSNGKFIYKNIPIVNFKSSTQRTGKFNLSSYLNVFKTAKYLVQKKSKYALLIYSTNLLKYFPIFFSCVLYKIPFFLWEVEKRSAVKKNKSIRSFVNNFGRSLSERVLTKFATGMVVISSLLKDYYSKFISSDKILVSPIIVNPSNSLVQNKSELFGELSGFVEQKKIKNKVIVYSGSFGEKDGFIFILKALQNFIKVFPDSILLATGKPSKYNPIENIEAIVKQMDLTQHFKYLGLVSREELDYINSKADLLLVCRSNSEFARYGFPWKLGEYLMTKKPVLATKVGDIDKYLIDKKEIFFAIPEDYESIGKIMGDVFRDYAYANQVAMQGYHKAIHVFNYLQETEKIKHFISKYT